MPEQEADHQENLGWHSTEPLYASDPSVVPMWQAPLPAIWRILALSPVWMVDDDHHSKNTSQLQEKFDAFDRLMDPPGCSWSRLINWPRFPLEKDYGERNPL